MSYDYILYLDAASAPDVERTLLGIPGFERADEGDALLAPGLWTLCRRLAPSPFDATIASTFGVRRRVTVMFVPDKFDDHAEGIGNMIAAVDTLLAREPGNLVLLGNGEASLLLRDAAGLALDGGADFWRCYGAIERMTHPFRWRSLPTL